MWLHPDTQEKSIVEHFPEIFEKHDFLYFSLPGDRMSNFFASANFLDGSRRGKNMADLFSAVQSACTKQEYKSYQSYIKGKSQLEKLAAATTPDEVKVLLDTLDDEYNDAYGMARQIRTFYQTYLDANGKSTLLNKIPRPGGYKPTQYQDDDGQIRVRVDLLLDLRDRRSHAASYIPLPTPEQVPYWFERETGNPRSVWLISLTFDELYEITRKALAQLWLQEYEAYWNNGGKQVIEKLVAEVQAQCNALNAKKTI